jgi:AraC-like DNA-binding protein
VDRLSFETCQADKTLFRAHFSDLEEIAGRAGWDLEVEQLERGSVSANLGRLTLPQGRMGFEAISAGVRMVGHKAEDSLQLLGLTSQREFRIYGKEAREAFVLVGPSSPLDLVTRSATRGDSIIIDPSWYGALFAGQREAAAVVDRCRTAGVFFLEATPALKEAFYRLARVDRHGENENRHSARLIGGEALTVAGRILGQSLKIEEALEPYPRRRRAFLDAEELMRADPAFPLTSQDLCQRAGVSERTLATTFLEEVGLSPMAYLRCLRLNVARDSIRMYARQSLHDPVSQAAWEVGWRHAGRFAQAYYRHFGEYPRKTAEEARRMWTNQK